MKKIVFLTSLFSLMLAAALPGFGQTAAEIIREMDKRSDNGPSRMKMKMEVYEKEAVPSNVRPYDFIMIGRDETTSYLEFTGPRSVAGMKILSREPDNWVYFPSTGRVRKITGSSRSGSVQGIGGDFSYADLSFGDWEKKYAFTVNVTTDAEWTLEGTARKADEAYTRVKVVVLRATFRPVRVDFQNSSDGWSKTLEFSDYRDFSGKPEAGRMVMRNLKKQSMTVLTLLDVSYDIKADSRYFEPNRFYK